jgi:hypothetical protein
MPRLGHSSVRAAMIYQHATRNQAIATALGTFLRSAECRGNASGRPGTGGEGGVRKTPHMARVWHAGARRPASNPQSNTENYG